MRAFFTIEEPKLSLSLVLPFLGFGLISLGLGLRGAVQIGETLLGETPWPAHFGWGVMITILALGFGCLFIWPIFIPTKTVVIDADAQVVRVAYRSRFGLHRDDVFALSDISPPEMVWHKNSEYSAGGFWELKLTLPDGRAVTRSPDSPNLEKQKKEVEAWLVEIQAMRH